MKENSLGPRKWAFVVISGGAACALPFVHTSDSAQPSQREVQPDVSYGAIALPLATRSDVTDSVHQSPPQLPEWASANRSPFDELVGVTAPQPKPPAPTEQLPMQPLRPWISGPPEAPSLTANIPSLSASSELAQTSAGTAELNQLASSGIDKTPRSTGELSPWRDEPHSWSSASAAPRSVEQLATAQTPSVSALAQSEPRALWPDQKVPAEEIARLTQPERRELVSAVVMPPASSDVIPAFNSSTRPVSAQIRFGQATWAPSPQPDRSAPTTPTSALPELPEARKKHIIFQPSARK